MIMRASTRTAVATTAFLSGRAGAFLSSGGLWRHEGISRANTARCLSMEAEREKVGFIGLGIMGTGMASNLIKGGRDVIVWNRTASKAADFSKRTGCETAATPKEVVEQCSITYSMLSTPEAASEVFFDPHDGVLAGLSKGKCLVDCATLQVEDMLDMYSETIGRGAKFLEAPVSGSKGPAEAGQLVFLCGGDEDLFERASEDLDLMGKASHYLGPAGKGTEMKLVVNMIMSTMLASVAEGMCLGDSLGLSSDSLIEILGQGAMASPMVALKGPLMAKKDYSSNFPLKHAQKDMRFALGLGDKAAQALPVAAAANAEYLRAKKIHADDDFCAVVEALRSKPEKINSNL
ncbi:unnamed protein product [Ectocarpus sp. 6 AP-2014]